MWPCVGRIPWWGICRCDSNVDLNVCRGLLAACAAAWWRRGGGGAEGRHGLAREVRQWERGRERVSVCLFVTFSTVFSQTEFSSLSQSHCGL